MVTKTNEEGWITYMSGDDLLERARAEREALAAIWRGLSAEDMTRRPGPHPEWSVKDLIAHITWWEQSATNLVSRALSGEMLTRPKTTDEVNASVYEDNRDLPLQTVLEMFEASFTPLEKLLGRMTTTKSMTRKSAISAICRCCIFWWAILRSLRRSCGGTAGLCGEPAPTRGPIKRRGFKCLRAGI